jgi:hypothetical protein
MLHYCQKMVAGEVSAHHLVEQGGIIGIGNQEENLSEERQAMP